MSVLETTSDTCASDDDDMCLWHRHKRRKPNGVCTTKQNMDISIRDCIGKGGNGKVYAAIIDGVSVAIKTFDNETNYQKAHDCCAHIEKQKRLQLNRGENPITTIPKSYRLDNTMQKELSRRLNCCNVQVMEHVGGRILGQIVGETPIPRVPVGKAISACATKSDRGTARKPARMGQPKLLLTATQIAIAVRRLHSIGVSHGDLSTNNVLVDYDDDGEPTIKLVDFDTASLLPLTTRNQDEIQQIENFPIATWEIVSGDILMKMTKIMLLRSDGDPGTDDEEQVEVAKRRAVSEPVVVCLDSRCAESRRDANNSVSKRSRHSDADEATDGEEADTTDSDEADTKALVVDGTAVASVCSGGSDNLFSLWTECIDMHDVYEVPMKTNPLHNDRFAVGVLMLFCVLGGRWGKVFGLQVDAYVRQLASDRTTAKATATAPGTAPGTAVATAPGTAPGTAVATANQHLSHASIQFLYLFAVYSRLLDPCVGNLDDDLRLGMGVYSRRLVMGVTAMGMEWPPTNPRAVKLLELLEKSESLKQCSIYFNEELAVKLRQQILILMHPEGRKRQWTSLK
jgi:hypothetical protein